MSEDVNVGRIAAALLASVSVLVRRVRQLRVEDELTMPERTALSRLDRAGPTTSAELARQEQISPQSIGATFSALQARGLVERRPDPHDGRRVVLAVTEAGAQVLKDKRNARTEFLARALAGGFTQQELKQLAAAAPLLERLAQHI
jgi:DNA-binding MarR family transcriptional regulator